MEDEKIHFEIWSCFCGRGIWAMSCPYLAFQCLESVVEGTIRDSRDSQIYKTVKIGIGFGRYYFNEFTDESFKA